jgi:hypothetical protein
VLRGPQGSGKSGAMAMIKALLDPTRGALRSAPRDERDLAVAAANSWALCYDNLSNIPGWFSDALCRLSTGGGFATRELFSDGDEIVFSAQRPVILGGIENLLHRGDLAERAVVINFAKIEDSDRRTEADINAEFDRIKGELLGALFSAASSVLRNIGSLNLADLPRMADFAKLAVAAEEGLGLRAGSFMECFAGARDDVAHETVDGDPLATALRDIAKAGWTGTAGDLLGVVSLRVSEDTRRSKSWPTTPRALSGQLARLAPVLARVGVMVEQGRREPGGARRRMIVLSERTG